MLLHIGEHGLCRLVSVIAMDKVENGVITRHIVISSSRKRILSIKIDIGDRKPPDT